MHGEGIAAVIFLILYTINLSILAYGYITRRIVFKSVYSFLLFHVILRLSAQSVGLAIGVKKKLDFGLLIAYFVLGAEGYFSLVLCSYRFLIHHHQHTYPLSGSFLEGKPRKRSDRDPLWRRFLRAMTARDRSGEKDPWVMTWIHWTLIGANTIIIVGGTRVNGSDISESDYWHQLHLAGILRAVGQALFLVINLFLIVFLLLSREQDQNPRGTIPVAWTKFFRVSSNHGEADTLSAQGRRLDGYTSSLHPTLKVLFIAWPPLIVRGIFGLLQSQVSAVNYATPAAYTSEGFTSTFIAVETILAVLPEWTACCLLCATMFTRETFNPKILQAETDKAGGHEGKNSRFSEGQPERVEQAV